MNPRMSTTFAAVAILLGLSAFSPAHAASGGGQKIKEALAQLDLSASQKTQIKQIVSQGKESGSKSGKTCAKAGGGAKGNKGEARSGAGKEMLEKIMAVLTPQQKSKLVQLIKSEKSKK